MVTQVKEQLNSAPKMESVLFIGVCVCLYSMCVSVHPLTPLNHLLYPVDTGSVKDAHQPC